MVCTKEKGGWQKEDEIKEVARILYYTEWVNWLVATSQGLLEVFIELSLAGWPYCSFCSAKQEEISERNLNKNLANLATELLMHSVFQNQVRTGGGIEIPENYVDVICEWSLSQFSLGRNFN